MTRRRRPSTAATKRPRVRCTPAALALALALALHHAVTLAAGQADVTVSLGTEDVPWVGQQVTVNLDLKTDDLSFANVFFNLPAVEGAFLLRTDSTTVKLTERRDGEDWQVLRHPVALFPQADGEVTVPAFAVRFDTTAGFGSEATSHAMTTEPLTVTVRRPPGAADETIVVTSRDHALEQDWASPPEPVEAGDAFTLTVHRRAADISAMLLPPLPVYETAGLAAYPAAPEIQDRANRGQLVGERTDRVTWVVERPGDYTIPAIRFQWWDPGAERLRDERVAGVSFRAEPAPGEARTADTASAPPGAVSQDARRQAVATLAVLAAAAALLALGWRFRVTLRRGWRRILPPPRALLRDLNPPGTP